MDRTTLLAWARSRGTVLSNYHRDEDSNAQVRVVSHHCIQMTAFSKVLTFSCLLVQPKETLREEIYVTTHRRQAKFGLKTHGNIWRCA